MRGTEISLTFLPRELGGLVGMPMDGSIDRLNGSMVTHTTFHVVLLVLLQFSFHNKKERREALSLVTLFVCMKEKERKRERL
jgi:hypothetical protein